MSAEEKLVEAQVAAAATPAEELAALTRHLTRMEQIEQRIRRLYDLGAKGGEANSYALAKLERQNAEIAILKARIKAKR